VRKRPGLASEIFDVLYLYGDFFLYFPPDGVLEALAGLHETCNDAIPRGRKVGIPCKKQLAIFFDCNDHGRRHGRIKDRPAGRTNFSVIN